MPKATVKLSNGTVITVDGTAEDAARIVAAATGNTTTAFERAPHTGEREPAKKKRAYAPLATSSGEPGFDLMEVVHLAKTCDEADAIEKCILDNRSPIHKVILPLYLVHKYKNNAFSLTSGDISKVLRELGTPMPSSNISRSLTGDARSYVVGDKARVKGRAIGYKIIRRGCQLLEKLFSGKATEGE